LSGGPWGTGRYGGGGPPAGPRPPWGGAWGVGRGAWGVGRGGAVSPGGSPAPCDELLPHDPDGRRALLPQVLPVEADLVEPRGPRHPGAPDVPLDLFGSVVPGPLVLRTDGGLETVAAGAWQGGASA